MRILTNHNRSFDLTNLPDQVDDLRYAVLDNSDPADPDYYFNSLIFLESFLAPALLLQVAQHQLTVPINWHVLIGEPDHGELELVPLTSISDRGFSCFAFNPLSSFRPEFLSVDVRDVYTDTRWHAPKMRTGQLLCVPVADGAKPTCIYLAREVTRSTELVQYARAW